MWWSFYETGADFAQFVTSALAYLTNRTFDDVAGRLGPLEREQELLGILDREPHLVVLDGLERLLVAYARLDFAHVSDDDLDARTANAVARSRQPSTGAADTTIGQHQLRKTIDPRVGNFLRRLAGVRSSRVLVTTRLYPSELQTITGHELPGCAAEFLKGLQPADALALWRGMGVSGSDEQLDALFSTFERYPLLIRALAGKVARYRQAPGNYDRWRADNPTFDPFALPLVQVRSHVLTHALLGLEVQGHAILRTVAGSRQPVDYAALTALCVDAGLRLSVETLDDILTDLEDRGLLGWDRQSNRYDLHPIVRGVVWHGLDVGGQREVYETLASHFEAVPTPNSEEMSLADARPVIELFNALVGLGQLAEASNLYVDRLNFKVDFVGEGAVHEKIAMLESVLPEGRNPPTDAVNEAVVAQLGHGYVETGRLANALACYREMRADGAIHRAQLLHFRGEVYWRTGRLKDASRSSELASKIQLRYSRETAPLIPLGSDTEYGFAAIYRRASIWSHAVAGRLEEARRTIRSHEATQDWSPESDAMVACIWAGDYATAAELGQTISDDVRPPVGAGSLAEAEIYLGSGLRHEGLVRDALSWARAKSHVETEVVCRRLLAELLRQKGEPAEGLAVLDDFWDIAARGPHRLQMAEGYLVLARIRRDLGEPAAAKEAAQEAAKQAECDGPPWSFLRAVNDSRALLKELEGT